MSGGLVAQCLGRQTFSQAVVNSTLSQVAIKDKLLARCSHPCASVTKQYNLVPAKERWCSVAGKVWWHTGHASQTQCFGCEIEMNTRLCSVSTMAQTMWLPGSYAGLWPLCFAANVLIFLFFAAWSPKSFSRSTTNFSMCSMVAQICKIQSEICAPCPKKFGCQKNIKLLSVSRLDRKCLRNAQGYHETENGVANCNGVRQWRPQPRRSQTMTTNLVKFIQRC